MVNEIESSYNTGLTSNNTGFSQASALQIRLDSSAILENIELFLRGAKLVVEENEKGDIVTKRVPLGSPIANDLGIQGILNWIQSVMNAQIVQGNFAIDGSHRSSQYEEYMFFFRIDLAQTLLENIYEWDIVETNLNLVTDTICNTVEPFMTRLIGNKERESYTNTITHQETNKVHGKDNGLGIFKS